MISAKLKERFLITVLDNVETIFPTVIEPRSAVEGDTVAGSEARDSVASLTEVNLSEVQFAAAEDTSEVSSNPICLI